MLVRIVIFTSNISNICMLKDKLSEDIKNALKTGDAMKRMVLGLLQSAIKNKELQKRAKSGKEEELNDEEVLDVIVSETKKRKESIESYEKGGRDELAQKERDELAILMGYMPEQISEDGIRIEVKKAIAETGADNIKEMGKVLGILMPRLRGRADGQTVSRVTKEEIDKLSN